MSKRNFILLIIISVIVVAIALGFLYFTQPAAQKGENIGGINFGSIFNPFGPSKPAVPPAETPPADISGYQPESATPEIALKLRKISSMPIAGFGVFNKERLIDVPAPAPVNSSTPVKIYDFGAVNLKEGSTGEAVKEVQEFLNNTLNLGLAVDGVLSPEIITTIKKWQDGHDLVVDGIIGRKTKAKMYASVNQTTETTTPTPPLTEFALALRYVDRAKGNIYQTFVDKISERKFSTAVIPKVYEALWGKSGETVIARYLQPNGRIIETFVGNLPKELLGGDSTIENNEIKGTFLPNNTKDASLSPDTGSVFYLFESGDGMVGTILNLATDKKTQIFDSAFTEWLSFWPTSKMITLTTKPSYLVPGYMYILDINNKNLNQVLGNINGLTTLASPDGKLILYGDNNLSLNLFHLDTKTTEPVEIRTLPEKCVWNKTGNTLYCAVPKSTGGGQYPDAWYQGEVSFSDQIWKIDTETGNATIIVDPITAVSGEEIDGIKLAMNEDENYLFFVNKKDSFLWGLGLK